jgi:Tfp pilus assembly PilM family ATPase
MKESHFMEPPSVYIEIRQSSLKALKSEAGLELPLERNPSGGLTKACREKVTIKLQGFLKKEVWQPRFRAYCAIGARGVSFRRLTLPGTSKENLKRLLALQIESEFPLPPDALAWGYRQIYSAELPAGQSSTDSGAKQELLVAAVKKEVIEEYAEILSECGVTSVFTVAALARRHAWPHPPQTCALLDVGRDSAELITFENGVPLAVRVLPWGGESMTRAIADQLGTNRDEAEKIKLAQDHSGDAKPGPIQVAIDAALGSLAGGIKGQWTGQKIYLSGRSAQFRDFAPRLARRLGNGAQCELLDLAPGEGRSAAVLGLRTATANGAESPLVMLQSKPTNGANLARPTFRKWVALALGLAIFSLALPYLEAPLLKGRLSKRLKAIQADRGRLVAIDRDLDFLRYLKQNQPPYLDALFLLAKAAPPGTKVDSLSMNRRGDLALRGSMKDGQQVVAFRSKLIDSGFFASVAVEEQTPTPDRQKVTVRITAQWKPANDRLSLSIGPTAEELEKAKNRPKDPPPGAFPPMDMGSPGGIPPMLRGSPIPGRGRGISAPGNPTAMPSPPPAANP